MIGKADLQNDLYFLQASSTDSVVNASDSRHVDNCNIDVWHNRLGHMFDGVSQYICTFVVDFPIFILIKTMFVNHAILLSNAGFLLLIAIMFLNTFLTLFTLTYGDLLMLLLYTVTGSSLPS